MKGKYSRKYVGLTIGLLMVFSLAIPMLTTVAPAPIMEEPFAVINSAQSGAWNVGATWVGGTPPGTGDNAVILNTHDVSLPANTLTGSCEVQSGGTITGAGYTLTCDDENLAGFTFDLDGTISGVLDLTFTYAGATNVDFIGLVAVYPADVICNNAALNVTQTTGATITSLTVTAGSWDCNDQDLTISGAADIDDELVGGSGTIKFGDNADFTGGTFYYETSTVQITSSMQYTMDTAYVWDLVLDDNVVVTIGAGEFCVAYNTITIDGTTAGGFTGTGSIYPNLASGGATPAQALFCGPNVDFDDCPMVIDIVNDGSTKFDGATFNDVTLGESQSATFTLTNRSMTCVNFTLDSVSFETAIFDTSTYDFHSTGTFTMTEGQPQAITEFRANSNDIIFAGPTTFGGNSKLFTDSANVYITDAFTSNAATTMAWNTSTTVINGTAEQTITPGGSFPYHNLTINNSHATDSVIFATNVDIDGNFTGLDGQVDMATNNVDFNTALNVTISNTTTFSFGGGTWEFDGDTNYTDSHATAQNIDDIIVTGTLFVLSDIAAENITVNDTGFLDLTANQILTLNGNTTINTSASYNRGSTIWDYNGTVGQTVILNGHNLFRANVRNTAGIITFTNDTNITWLYMFANTTMVLQDDITASNLICTGTTGQRVNFSSNDTTERFMFNPIEQRSLEVTYFTDVTLVPPEPLVIVGGADPSPPPPPPVVEEPPPADGGGLECSLFMAPLAMCLGGGGLAYWKRRKKSRQE